MNAGPAIKTTALITALTLTMACAGADAVDPPSAADHGKAAMLEARNPEIDFYRAEGLPELYGSACGKRDRTVIGIQYTHSHVTGDVWQGSGDAAEEFVRHRGKYGENLQVESNGDQMRLYAYDYYARGRPGELIIIGRPGSSSEDKCMIGVLTDEKLQQQLSDDTERPR